MTRVKDLKDQTGMTYPRPFLHCGKCGQRAGVGRGDYRTEGL
jgi:hypothetical protein